MRTIVRKFLVISFWSLSLIEIAAQDLKDKRIGYTIGCSLVMPDPVYLNELETAPKFRPFLGVSFINESLFSHEVMVREVWLKKEHFRTTANGSDIVIAGGERKNLNLSMRYAYGRYFPKNGRIIYQLSFGVVPEYQFSKWDPLIGSGIYETHTFNVFAELIPQLSFLLNRGTMVNLEVPLKINNIGYTIEDPLPNSESHQPAKWTESKWFPGIMEIKVSFSYLK